MMYMRGQPGDFDHWRDAGNPGWGYDDVLPVFRRSETNERGASALHGGTGLMQVSKGSPTAPVCDLFLEAARNVGHQVTDDMNRPADDAFGHVDMNLRRGRRSSTAGAFLRPRLGQPNLTVLANTEVRKIVMSKGRAEAIVCATHGKGERRISVSNTNERMS